MLIFYVWFQFYPMSLSVRKYIIFLKINETRKLRRTQKQAITKYRNLRGSPLKATSTELQHGFTIFKRDNTRGVNNTSPRSID